jgi:hypothetical protein
MGIPVPIRNREFWLANQPSGASTPLDEPFLSFFTPFLTLGSNRLTNSLTLTLSHPRIPGVHRLLPLPEGPIQASPGPEHRTPTNHARARTAPTACVSLVLTGDHAAPTVPPHVHVLSSCATVRSTQALSAARATPAPSTSTTHPHKTRNPNRYGTRTRQNRPRNRSV